MLNLIKFLKGHSHQIVLIMILLVLQAVCELSLPAYTSDIVDVGIQQGGIESGVPTIIRGSSLEQLKHFMNQSDAKILEGAYQQIRKESLSDEKWKIKISEPVYKLKEAEDSNREGLTKILKNPMVTASFMQAAAKQGKGQGGMNSAASLEKINAAMAQYPEMVKEQMMTAYVKAEYEAIGVDIGKIQNSYILKAGLKMLGLSLLSMITTIFVGLLASRVAAKVGMELRVRVFRKVVSFSNAEMDKFSTASLITRSTNDIQQIQLVVVLILRMVLYAPIMGIGGIIKVLNTNVSMAWIIFAGVTAILCVVGILFIVAMPKFKMMQNLVDRINLVTREILTGLPVIRAFSTEKYEERRFDVANQDLTKTQLFTNRAMTFMMPAMMLIMNAITLMIVWFGAKGIDAGNLQVGDMMAFITYAILIVISFLMLTMISIWFPRAIVASNRIGEVLETELSIKEPEKAKTGSNLTQGVIEFMHVNFRYPNAEENVLEDITFIAKPGETTAFIGSTGSGKSTLINLIPRFYDVTGGSIKIDGVDIRELNERDLRDKVGYVPQKGVLFSGTIDSNLRFGNKEAGTEEIVRAARIAQATEFIEAKPEKYKSEIAQGGANVSGGQKQRLSIARAIAKNPQIFIFDDSFSALDYKTDITLRNALKEETQGSTVIIVAQRISTIMNADQIIVLDEGKIAGIGTHRELLKNNEVYQQIAMSQLSKEELEGGESHE